MRVAVYQKHFTQTGSWFDLVHGLLFTDPLCIKKKEEEEKAELEEQEAEGSHFTSSHDLCQFPD